MTTMREDLIELWRFRYLLKMLVSRELKVRYKNSALGFIWSIVPPLLSVLVLTVFVKKGLGATAANYAPFLLCGIIPWTFFSVAILDSSQSLLVNWGVIKKVYMPREVIPLAIIISNFIHFMLGWCVFITVFIFAARLIPGFKFGIPLRTEMLWFPVIVLVEAILVTGASLWVAALNTFYEDVRFILQTLFGLVYFVFPILFPVEAMLNTEVVKDHPWIFTLYMLNPITAIIDAFRKTLMVPLEPIDFQAKLKDIHPFQIHWGLFAMSSLISVIILISGYAYFNHVKWKFVERN